MTDLVATGLTALNPRFADLGKAIAGVDTLQ